MNIQSYFSQIKRLLDRYAATDLVIDLSVQFDERPGDQGFLSGSVVFKNLSAFFFREFLDVENERIDKIMYSYHYQNADAVLIFRYDNALHKPALPFREHKHTEQEILAVSAPKLDDVLLEILLLNRWL